MAKISLFEQLFSNLGRYFTDNRTHISFKMPKLQETVIVTLSAKTLRKNKITMSSFSKICLWTVGLATHI